MGKHGGDHNQSNMNLEEGQTFDDKTICTYLHRKQLSVLVSSGCSRVTKQSPSHSNQALFVTYNSASYMSHRNSESMQHVFIWLCWSVEEE
jgi:hypothetical protein